MKKRILGGLLAALFIVGLMAPAASASVNGVAVFEGVADVGTNFSPPCTKDGGTASGTGLEVVPSSAPHTWSLSAPFNFVGSSQNATPGLYTGDFDVCGWMAGPLGQNIVGASCTTTKGYGGQGLATAGPIKIKLFNIGWKAAVGSLLIVNGNYQEYASNGTKKAKFGTILAVVGASPLAVPPAVPPVPCLPGSPAEEFTIVGAAVLLNGGPMLNKENSPILDPLDSKACNKSGTGGSAHGCPTPKSPTPPPFPG